MATVTPLIVACAVPSTATPVSHAYFAELDRTAGPGLSAAVEAVLQERYGFSVLRQEEHYATVYYETRWNDRDVFADEEAEGVIAARSRIVLRGSRVGGGVYRLVFEGENQVRTDSVPAWHTMPVTMDFREWMEEIGEVLRRESARHPEAR